jgi:hypothetical protein
MAPTWNDSEGAWLGLGHTFLFIKIGAANKTGEKSDAAPILHFPIPAVGNASLSTGIDRRDGFDLLRPAVDGRGLIHRFIPGFVLGVEL